MRQLLLIALLAAGCGNATGPVIDDLQMPATSQVGADGFYSVEGLISFHDDASASGGSVNKIRIHVASVGQTYDFDAQGGLNRGTLPLVVKFSSASPKGYMQYDVSLVDAAGSSSAARNATVQLQ
jgi:hypothetical protein